ncbi:fatty acid desaturase family protein [Burkholderiaceae bacterium FT117]|uniref:fatty acid desaturase family protein n=1 Tax=Zeimonas sediminis TaxID=2944268 RepID=UPI002342C912|nr:fatty acid desaturase family protein [Zeimonas sediminis]MCM5569238.1 fatty acid desaturase family protein [Zeimonas sediminis]
MEATTERTRGEEFREDLRGATGAAVQGRATRRLLSADELAPFLELDDRRSALAVLQTFAIAGGAVAIALAAWGNWWVVAACVAVIATQQHALFVLAHDAAHYRLFSSRRVNDAVGRLCGVLGGVSMCTYRVTHRLHHNHLYGRQDPDIALNGGYPRGRAYLLKKLAVDLTGWTAPKTFAYFFGAPSINSDTNEAQRPLNDTSPALRQAARSDRWLVAGFHVGAPIACAALGGWPAFSRWFVLWMLPLLTLLQPILRMRAVAEHGAPAGYDSPLRAARTNLPGRGPMGWLVRAVFFPHHVNYHVEHHLYPAVPHYRLPALHRLLRERGLLDEAEVRPFGQTLRRVFSPRGSIPEALRPERA